MNAQFPITPETPVALRAGTITAGNTTANTWGEVQNCWIPTVPYPRSWISPTTISYTMPQKNDMEVAFKVVKRLMETGVIGEMTVKQFIAAVEDVAKVL